MDLSLTPGIANLRSLVLHNLIVLAAYLATGIATLLWSLDAGAAVPLWIAAGIALVAVLWRGLAVLPAVFLAGVCVNLFVGLWIRGATLSDTLIYSLMLAVKPVVEVLLIRWFLLGTKKSPLSFDDMASIVRIPLAVIVGCLIAAAYGAAILNMGNFGLPVERGLSMGFLRDLIVWWVGDALGCLIILSIMLPWLQGQRPSLRQYLLTSMPNVVLLAAVLTAFFLVRELEQQKQREHVDELLSVLTHELTQQIDHAVLLAQGLAAYFEGSEEVSATEFATYAKTMLSHRDQVVSLQWLPLVPDTARVAHETAIRQALGVDFTIRERVGNEIHVSRQRDFYLPISYVAPFESNRGAHGLDVLHLEYREKPLRQAIAAASSSVSKPIRLVQDLQKLPAYIVAIPIYTRDVTAVAPQDRFQFLHGVVQSAFRFGGLDSRLRTTSFDAFALSVTDVSDPQSPVQVYGTAIDSKQAQQREFVFGDRRWQVSVNPPLGFWGRGSHWQMYGILIAGLLLVALFQVLILSIAGREKTIHHQVHLKTQEMLAARDAATKASQAKSDFLSNMSYELRTPLTAILGFARQIRRAEAFVLTMQSRDSLAAIERNGELLLGIINDMLDLAKIEAGKVVELRYELIALDTHLRALARQYKTLADDKGLRLLVDADSQITINADRQRLSQIVLNLLSNAIKFTEQGSITLTARPELRAGREGVVICVRDTGNGITPELLPRLFRKFDQFNSQDGGGMRGTGLGLALVHELTLMHGGEIRVESTLGAGSEFFLWLPRQVQ